MGSTRSLDSTYQATYLGTTFTNSILFEFNEKRTSESKKYFIMFTTYKNY